MTKFLSKTAIKSFSEVNLFEVKANEIFEKKEFSVMRLAFHFFCTECMIEREKHMT